MQYDPKLKIVIEEIKAIMVKHDCAGVCIVHGKKGFSEYLQYVTPSYSCAKIENGKFTIKGQLKHFNNDKVKQQASHVATSNMLAHFSEVLGRLAMNYVYLKDIADKLFGSEHDTPGHQSHDTQNN